MKMIDLTMPIWEGAGYGEILPFTNSSVRLSEYMVAQNRCFAALGWDKQVRDICQAHGIIYQGFSLLTANREVLVDPEIRAIARRLGAGIAQVIFRFAMGRRCCSDDKKKVI